MPDVTPDEMAAKNQALPLSQDDKLRYRGSVATFARRYFPNGLRRRAVLVFEGDDFAVHAVDNQLKVIPQEGDAFAPTIEGVDERGAIVLSK